MFGTPPCRGDASIRGHVTRTSGVGRLYESARQFHQPGVSRTESRGTLFTTVAVAYYRQLLPFPSLPFPLLPFSVVTVPAVNVTFVVALSLPGPLPFRYRCCCRCRNVVTVAVAVAV